jgi:altronate dehydratase
MTPEERERMHALCERIAKEQNHEKFVKLVQELNDLLEHKQERLEDPSKQS